MTRWGKGVLEELGKGDGSEKNEMRSLKRLFSLM